MVSALLIDFYLYKPVWHMWYLLWTTQIPEGTTEYHQQILNQNHNVQHKSSCVERQTILQSSVGASMVDNKRHKSHICMWLIFVKQLNQMTNISWHLSTHIYSDLDLYQKNNILCIVQSDLSKDFTFWLLTTLYPFIGLCLVYATGEQLRTCYLRPSLSQACLCYVSYYIQCEPLAN